MCVYVCACFHLSVYVRWNSPISLARLSKYCLKRTYFISWSVICCQLTIRISVFIYFSLFLVLLPLFSLFLFHLSLLSLPHFLSLSPFPSFLSLFSALYFSRSFYRLTLLFFIFLFSLLRLPFLHSFFPSFVLSFRISLSSPFSITVFFSSPFCALFFPIPPSFSCLANQLN